VQALFSEDFYFKYGLRPTPSDILSSPFLPPQAALPFSPIQRRYTGYQKYAPRITAGVEAFKTELKVCIHLALKNALCSFSSNETQSTRRPPALPMRIAPGHPASRTPTPTAVTV